MIIKNKSGKERNLELLLEVNKNDNNYLVYKDNVTNKIYAGKRNNNKLEVLNEEEFSFLDIMLKKIDG